MAGDDEKDPEDTSALNTASPQRNFTMTLDERVRGLAGPPAYAVRRRRIEDLEAWLVNALRELPKADDGEMSMYECYEDSLPRELKNKLIALNKLVEQHNKYYPMESNLPIDVATGQLMDSGEPWKPVPLRTWAMLTLQANEKKRPARR